MFALKKNHSSVFAIKLILLSICVSLVDSEQCNGYPSSLCNTTISDARFLKTTSEKVIHLGVSLRIIQNNNNKESKHDFDAGFKNDIITLFTSILQLSTGATQHWIIMTDKNSILAVNKVLRHLITKHVSENLLRTYTGRARIRRVPKIVIDYVDLDDIPVDEKDKLFIRALKLFLPDNMEGQKKYTDNLFYMGPLYHRIFPALKKLILLDVDMEFFSDIKLLFNQFAEFSETNLLGVGHDLSPHYRLNLEQYRRWHPDSTLGDPGWSQGFNTGVVLYNLQRMRESQTWNSLLEPASVSGLMNRYGYHVSLGDQDWFTNVGFEHRDLFYNLPCQFNSQISVQYWRPPFESEFEEYHYCKEPFHIVHKNGCGPDRETCDEVLRNAGMIT